MACEQCEGIELQFGRSAARKKLRQFRRRGPDKTTRLLVDALRAALDSTDTRGVVLLDIGAGVGAIHHELLDGHVERAIHVDGSTAHLAAARDEAERRGHGPRVEFVHGDFVDLAGAIPAADVVTLDRVICCYHDMERLVGLSARKARRLYGAVYPRDVRWMHIAIRAINLLQRFKRSGFRVFLHSPAAIDGVLRIAGLERHANWRTLGWEVVIYERRTEPNAITPEVPASDGPGRVPRP
jgi:SAM-dependent methyltransferase